MGSVPLVPLLVVAGFVLALVGVLLLAVLRLVSHVGRMVDGVCALQASVSDGRYARYLTLREETPPKAKPEPASEEARRKARRVIG